MLHTDLIRIDDGSCSASWLSGH